MNTKVAEIKQELGPRTGRKRGLLDTLSRHLVINQLRGITEGQLILKDGNDTHRFGRITDPCPLSVSIHVNNTAFYSDVAFGGSIGAGEAYINNFWKVDDLTALVRILLCNRQVLDGMETGLANLITPLRRIIHWINRNTRAGSRRNIAAHYDLGNEFFRLMLDDTMMYSSAIFKQAGMDLYEAQLYRLRRICEKLDLKPTDHLLEIGTGWGGLAVFAASRYGCRVTTTTISREQYELALSRVKDAGLEGQVTILMDDYRSLQGQYDKLVSIEMIEAVGHHYYANYFSQCSRLLKPKGLMLLQAITITDQVFVAASKSVDFIKRYIFPGSCIPSVTRIMESVTANSNMRIFNLEDIGPHYATTLRKWRENIHLNRNSILSLGYSEEFLRMWEFYLCYCEGGFIERYISDVQIVLVKPENRRACISSSA